MRRSCCLVVTLALAAPAGAVAQDASVSERAQSAEERGELPRARELYEEMSRAEDSREAAEGLYRLGAMADGALEFRRALGLYRASVARDPSSRYAGRAIARASDLEEHSEGDFVPLVALERLRRDAVLSNDARAIEALEQQAEGFGRGGVRADAWLLVGDAYIGRLRRPRDAARVFRRLATDPGASEDLRTLAASRLVEARAMLGEESEAEREVAAVGAAPEVRGRARVLARRRALHRGATGGLLALGTTGIIVTLRIFRRSLWGSVLAVWRRPLPLAHIAVLSIGGAALSWKSDGHDPWPFFSLGLGTLALHLLGSAWNVVGSQRAAPRLLRAAACAAGVFAVAFLAMELLDTMMLEGIRL